MNITLLANCALCTIGYWTIDEQVWRYYSTRFGIRGPVTHHDHVAAYTTRSQRSHCRLFSLDYCRRSLMLSICIPSEAPGQWKGALEDGLG